MPTLLLTWLRTTTAYARFAVPNFVVHLSAIPESRVFQTTVAHTPTSARLAFLTTTMAVLSLPLTFTNSFWSQDYRGGLQVLFDKLEQVSSILAFNAFLSQSLSQGSLRKRRNYRVYKSKYHPCTPLWTLIPVFRLAPTSKRTLPTVSSIQLSPADQVCFRLLSLHHTAHTQLRHRFFR